MINILSNGRIFSGSIECTKELVQCGDAQEALIADDESRDHPYACLPCPSGFAQDFNRLDLDLRPSLTKLIEQCIREHTARSKRGLEV